MKRGEEIDLDSRWHVLVSVGDRYRGVLDGSPPDLRRRWLHYPTQPDPVQAGIDVMATFVRNACAPEGDFQFDNAPLVSVITPTHGHGANLDRCLESLKRQSYQNWEWVVYTNGRGVWSRCDGWQEMRQFQTLNPEKIVLVSDDDVPPSVGAIKRRAFGVARGQLLLELDHDDELTPNALADLVQASIDHPECGFFYSDCAEVIDGTYEPIVYGEGWGKGYGSYRTEDTPVVGEPGAPTGSLLLTNVTNYPPVNLTTLSHIVGVPNHFRAWRRSAYHQAGGHSPELFVADDYELLLRTFLTTRMCHVTKLGYIQHQRRGDGAANTQDDRRPEIQRLVRWIWDHYEAKVTERELDLRVGNWAYDPKHLEVRWPSFSPRNFQAVRWPSFSPRNFQLIRHSDETTEG